MLAGNGKATGFARLVITMDLFPEILEEERGLFEEIQEVMDKRNKKRKAEGKVGIVHGGFWAGKYVFPDSLTPSSVLLLSFFLNPLSRQTPLPAPQTPP